MNWMKDLNLVAYVLGTVLGGTFILGVIVGNKKMETDNVLHVISHKYNKLANFGFQMMLGILAVVAVEIVMTGKWMSIKSWLGLTYWLSMALIVAYVLTRRIVFTKDGIGFLDMFGKTSGLFYKWKQIKSIDIDETSVLVTLAKKPKPIKMKVKLDTETVENLNKWLKKVLK